MKGKKTQTNTGVLAVPLCNNNDNKIKTTITTIVTRTTMVTTIKVTKTIIVMNVAHYN